MTAADRYLWRLAPATHDSRGRPRMNIPEARARTWHAVADAVAVLEPEPDATGCGRVMSVAREAAARHGAETGIVWRHLLRWRALTREAEHPQLELPLAGAEPTY